MKWPVVSLADALASAEVFVDGDWVESKDQDPCGDVRLVQLADVGDGEYLNKSARFLTNSKARQLRCTFLKPGDVLVARMPDPLGRACIFPGDPKPSVTAVDVCIIRPDVKEQNARWLMHCLNAPTCRSQIRGFATGTTRARISRSNLSKIKIPLPPLAEQQRIAEILDRTEALRAKRRYALAQLDTLTQAIFLDLFGDPGTNANNWPRKSLKDLGRITTGGTPPSAKPGMFGGPIPFVTPGDLENDEPVKRSLTNAGARESVTVRAGTMLVCCIGATIGKMAKVRERSAFNQQINAVEWAGEIDDNYGLAVLRFFKPTIAAWGASTTLPILKKSTFEKIEVPVPPLPLQREFARRVEAVEKLKTAHRTSLTELDALFASLQHRAFRGELRGDLPGNFVKLPQQE